MLEGSGIAMAGGYCYGLMVQDGMFPRDEVKESVSTRSRSRRVCVGPDLGKEKPATQGPLFTRPEFISMPLLQPLHTHIHPYLEFRQTVRSFARGKAGESCLELQQYLPYSDT